MTNFERWQLYMKDCTAPQSFIDMAYYFMIAVSLQRRVWMGGESPERNAVFPNIYVFLVGQPGLGKGISIVPAVKLLQSIKKGKIVIPESAKKDPASEEMMAIIDQLQAKQQTSKSEYDNMLFPVGADTTTFESLIQDHAQAVRMLRIPPSGRLYYHSSMYFTLEELGTLFRKNHENLMNYLLKSYDCNDFRYKTKSAGEDIVRNPSLNILAGTTYDFIKEATTDRMIGQGLTSRALFIAEEENRFYRFDMAEFSEAQREAVDGLREHLRGLSTAFGYCPLTPEAKAYFCQYFEQEFPSILLSLDPKLTTYYARKNIHARKLCMLLHFSENLKPGPITLEIAQRAMALLTALEPKIALAFSDRFANVKAVLANKILKLLQRPAMREVGMSYAMILALFFQEANEKDIMEALKYLATVKKIKTNLKNHYVAT